MIFKRGLDQDDAASIFIVDCISESRSWSRAGMEGIEYAAPLYLSNHSLATCRQQKADNGFHHTLVSDSMIESSYVSNKTGEITSQFPLFVLHDCSGRATNFDEEKLMELFSDVEQPDETSRKVYPEDIFDYIYASLHSPSYREKYKEFLKIDFPRVPRPKSWAEFWRLTSFGKQLRELHLMHGEIKSEVSYPEGGQNLVETLRRDGDRVYINDTQYFGNVSDLAYNFYIGGYQPAQKWIKDRRGRELSSDDIEHYEKIIAILEQTDKLMRRIG